MDSQEKDKKRLLIDQKLRKKKSTWPK